MYASLLSLNVFVRTVLRLCTLSCYYGSLGAIASSFSSATHPKPSIMKPMEAADPSEAFDPPLRSGGEVKKKAVHGALNSVRLLHVFYKGSFRFPRGSTRHLCGFKGLGFHLQA